LAILKDIKEAVMVVERAMPGGAAYAPLFNEIFCLALYEWNSLKIENYIIRSWWEGCLA
jgi:hypothetical protein